MLWESRVSRRRDRRNIDANRPAIHAIAVPMLGGNFTSCIDSRHAAMWGRAAAVERVRRALDVAGARKSGCVRSVLLCTAIEQILSNIEDECRDETNRHEPAREENENLPALAPGLSC
jgi:hypothetical protein